MRDARLFLFDEPLSNLDAQLRDEMRGEIKRLHQELGTTMIYVTHDQIEAMTLADRIVLLQATAAIEQQGAPLDLFERPATRFVAGFLGSPQMNFIAAGTEARGALDLCGRRVLACRCRTACPRPRRRPRRSCSASGRRISACPRDAAPQPGMARRKASSSIWCSRPARAATSPSVLGGATVMAEVEAHDVPRARASRCMSTST